MSCFVLSHHKGQSTNSATKGPDPRKLTKRNILTCLLHISADFFFLRCFISSWEMPELFHHKAPYKGTQTFIKIQALRELLHSPFPSPEHWEDDTGFSYVPCCSGLQEAGRDPQKLSTFHSDDMVDSFLFDSYFLCSFSGLICYSVDTWATDQSLLWCKTTA